METAFMAVVVLGLVAVLVAERKRFVDLSRRYTSLELEFREDGGRQCCACGKLYRPLNDPDYTPELNVCRDCLWKLHYLKTFEEGGDAR